MSLLQVSVRNLDTTLARSWTWAIYTDLDNANNAIARKAVASGSDAFTAGAASTRTLVVTPSPTILTPGSYWIAIQNNHASNSFAVGSLAGVGIASRISTKTLTPGLGTTLDIIAATWTLSAALPGLYIEGSVANSGAPWN